MTTDRKVHTVVKSKSLSRNRLTPAHRPGLFEPSVGRAVAGRHRVTDNGGGGAELAERGYRGVVTPITDCRRRSGTVKTLPQPGQSVSKVTGADSVKGEGGKAAVGRGGQTYNTQVLHTTDSVTLKESSTKL
jgi:hypothetical protein